MNAPAPPVKESTPEASTPTTGQGFAMGGFAILALLPLLYLLMFHAGAAYLSYQKFGSGAYAFLDFVFPYFYYPYYAFFLSGASVESPSVETMMGGFKKLFGRRRR